MKRILALLVCSAALVSGCGQSTPADSTDADSPPLKMLEAPEKAREAADKANEKVKGAMDALDEMNLD